MYSTRSSSAYSPTYENSRQKRLKLDEQAKKRAHLEQLKKKKAARRKTFYSVVNLLVAMSMCMGILFGYAQITKISRENDNLQKQYNDITAKNQKLQVDIQTMRDTKVIEDIAVNKLGMAKPEKYQTVYLDLGKTDHVNLTAQNDDKNEKKGFVASLSKSFYNVLEYLN